MSVLSFEIVVADAAADVILSFFLLTSQLKVRYNELFLFLNWLNVYDLLRNAVIACLIESSFEWG